MKDAPANFDSLAKIYRGLERLAFGGDLARARFSLLSSLGDAESILILGEGDGRCLERLTAIAPRARFHCVDASAAMLARAAARLAPEARERVRLQQADARGVALPEASFDAVVTLFFLDCFTADEVRSLVSHVAPALRPGARWLFADFCEPSAGWRRWRARAWLTLLYAFFRFTTRLSARRLPPAEEIIVAAGFAPQLTATFQQGMLRAVLFKASHRHSSAGVRSPDLTS